MLTPNLSAGAAVVALLFHLSFCLSTVTMFFHYLPVVALHDTGRVCMVAALWVNHGMCRNPDLRGKARQDVEGNSVLLIENPATTMGGGK